MKYFFIFATISALLVTQSQGNLQAHLDIFSNSYFLTDLPRYPILSGFIAKFELMRKIDGGISPECVKELLNFSNCTSEFISCALDNARPLHYCSLCVDEFLLVKASYESMQTGSGVNQSCDNEIISADQIQVVAKVWDFVEVVWKESECDKCFITTANGTYEMKNETIQMIDTLTETLNCFDIFSNSTDLGSVDTKVKLDDYESCTVCRKKYNEANDLYYRLDKEGSLCADLIDAMNYTRYTWGNTLNCHPVYETSISIIVITVVVGLLPLALYLGAYLGRTGPDFSYTENESYS